MQISTFRTCSELVGRTCSFYANQLLFEICFYFLNTTELVQRSGYIFDAAFTGHWHCEECLFHVRMRTRDEADGEIEENSPGMEF
jgi:hypothetical protein